MYTQQSKPTWTSKLTVLTSMIDQFQLFGFHTVLPSVDTLPWDYASGKNCTLYYWHLHQYYFQNSIIVHWTLSTMLHTMGQIYVEDDTELAAIFVHESSSKLRRVRSHKSWAITIYRVCSCSFQILLCWDVITLPSGRNRLLLFYVGCCLSMYQEAKS